MRRISRRTIIASILIALFVGAIGLFVAILILSKSLPSIEQIENRRVSQSTKIYDREGTTLLYEITSGQKRTVVPLTEIPQSLKDATILTEDENFYTEPGFDWRAIVRAFLVNIANRRIVQGGSTITQQLAKNAFLSPEQTLTRKLKEFLLAAELNRQYTKDEILSLYLNEIPYGPTASGVEAASRTYFNKSVKELNVAESALIAALPRAPSYYSPWGNHVSALIGRQQFILKKMQAAGRITQQELDEALQYELVFEPRSHGIKAPHFVMAVQDYLIEKYGEDWVRIGGLQVKTTLNWEYQEVAERVVEEGAKRNEDLYKGKNAALVAEDPKTGQILAFVGSRDYFDVENEGNFNVATQALRQPGSALKPFAYLKAFQLGYAPETVLMDVPTEFVPKNDKCPLIPSFIESDDDDECFHPQNFDEKFRGPVNLRTALAHSINVPAVKVLYLSGLQETIDLLHSFGITTLTDPRRYGLALVLGGGEIKLAELVGAYSVLADEGVRHAQSMILEIKDSEGQVLEAYQDESERVVDAQYPRLVNDILSDVDLRSGLFGASLNLTTFSNHDVALKTGTTNNYRDAWTFGYTPNLVVGVWAGNNNNAAMQKRGSSILAAVPIWSAFMKEVIDKVPAAAFNKPERVSPQKPVLAGDYLAGGQQPHTILYYVDKDDPAGDPPNNPSRDPQFENWETAVQAWAGHNMGIPGTTVGTAPAVQILSPTAGSFVTNGANVTVQIVGPAPLVRISILWNGATIQDFPGTFPAQYVASFSIFPPPGNSQNALEIIAVDALGQTGRSSVIVYQ